jgi:hypothetical protein
VADTREARESGMEAERRKRLVGLGLAPPTGKGGGEEGGGGGLGREESSEDAAAEAVSEG